MEDTGISQEIAALREQIAATEAAIARLQNRANQHRKAGEAGEAGDPASAETMELLRELVEAHDSMKVRLSRLESCKRTPGA